MLNHNFTDSFDYVGIDLSDELLSYASNDNPNLTFSKLYLLDEPIAGVDPAARDYILNTIISNYDPSAAVIISTHLIADVEQYLDEVIFINNGKILRHTPVDVIREEMGKTVDALFREEFRCF